MRIRHLFFIVVVLLLGCTSNNAQNTLQLEKVTVVSRHGARAPLDKYLDDLETLTPDGYHWYQWKDKGVNGSDLTPRGTALENLFGVYFRLWLTNEGLTLQENDVYFGASSKQRTIATARAFAAGLMPLSNITVDYKTDSLGNYGPLDQDYLPLFNNRSISWFDTTAFKEEARRELGKLEAPSYDFLEKVLRYDLSPRAKQSKKSHFDNFVDVLLNFYGEKGKTLEPTMLGDLNIANRASDAFILQYYEMENLKDAAFGHDLSFEEWQKLAEIKDYYGKILFTAPIIAVNVSHCMLERVKTEMTDPNHKFSFLCTHDSMIQALLAALRVDDYTLPETIETKTPIGFKFVIEQWKDVATGKRYVKPRLIYQSSEQIRKLQVLDLQNKPMSYDLSFKGLKKADHDMYSYDDFMKRIEETINAYFATAKGENPFPKK